MTVPQMFEDELKTQPKVREHGDGYRVMANRVVALQDAINVAKTSISQWYSRCGQHIGPLECVGRMGHPVVQTAAIDSNGQSRIKGM